MLETGNGTTKDGENVIDRRRLDTHSLFLLLLAALIFALMSLAMPRQFPTTTNLESMAFQMSEVGILTVAMALTMLIGGIDLSVTATANLSAISAGLVMAYLSKPGLPSALALLAVVGGLLAAMAVGLVCGLVNGLLIGRIGTPAILATLGTLTLYTGLAYGITKGHAVHGVPSQVLFLGIGSFLGIPLPLIIFMVVLAVVSVVLNHTTYGFRVYLLGSNATAARFSGIDNVGIILKTHLVAGLLSALTGIVTLARTNSAHADYGGSYVLMTILVAVLGGVAVSGGSGRLAGVTLALMTLQMLSTGFNMLLLRFSGSNFFRDFSWGFLLLFVMVLTHFSGRGGILAVWKRILSGK
jgi:simple sugar transport system permease protein